MTPLLNIKSIPIQLDIQVHHGKLEYTPGSSDLQISRQRGHMEVDFKHTQLKVDTFECRNSIRPTAFRSIEQSARMGMQAAAEAAASYARHGKRAMEVPIGEEVITQYVKEAQAKHVKTNVGIDFLPKGGAKISWDPGYIHMHYEMDKLNFDWRMNQQHFNYTPADVEIKMVQRPDVEITYVGEPIYVPKSANPNYQPLDTQA